MPKAEILTPRRSTRSNKGKAPHRLINSSYYLNTQEQDMNQVLFRCAEVPTANNPLPLYPTNTSCVYFLAEQPALTEIYKSAGIRQPYLFTASNSDPDTLSYEEAMCDVDKGKWIDAAAKVIQSLEDQNTWTEVDLSKATSRILPSQWVFKRKRTPDGNIKSYKARSVARGDLEEGTFETFTHVVAWSTVRFFLVLSLVLD
jgi:hypothetical protein